MIKKTSNNHFLKDVANKLNLQAGDRYDFTGTLIVVPDVGAMTLPGAKTQFSSRHKHGDEAEGVRGLKALGVRELHYRMAFLACSVQPTNPKFGGIELPLGILRHPEYKL